MKPILCNYYVTLRCNSKCVFCDIWKKEENKRLKEQTLEEVEANLKDLKKLGVKMIDFTGGEPLLYPHIIEALKLAKKIGFMTTITTNCLLYSHFAKDLKGLVDILQFSFESTKEERHNKTRGVKSFKKVMESIILAKKLKQKIVLIYTATNENIGELESLVKFAQKKKCLLYVNPCFEYFGNDGISKENIKKIGKYFWQAYVTMDLAHLELVSRGGNDTGKPTCKAVSSTVVISPDNYLLLPCYHKSIKKIKINGNLYELYNSPEVKKIREAEGRFKFCKGCTIYCYMRASFHRNLLSKYPPLYALSGIKYLREFSRKQD